MTAYLKNTLTYVWAFLTAITIISWWISQGGNGAEYQLNHAVTVSVLLIASVKAFLVIQHFMEVKTGPVWLKRTAYGWVVGLLVLLLVFYWAAV